MSELIENKIKQQDVVGIDLNEGANKEIVSSAKNSFLYFFEILSSFLIVFIHCSFPGDFGIIIKSLARFGVPLFFAISGFFLFRENATAKEIRTKIKKRASRISVLLLISFLIYLILGIITSVIGENPVGIINYLKNTFSVRKIALLLICNDPLTHFINWFMIAQLFSYLIIYLFPNLFLKNKKSVRKNLTDCKWLIIKMLPPVAALNMLPIIIPTSAQTHKTVVFPDVKERFINVLR